MSVVTIENVYRFTLKNFNTTGFRWRSQGVVKKSPVAEKSS